MSAIYQRARPIRWEQVVGQEHVKDVLRAALEQGRVGHAYLFSGPRGVGKTTTARLIAMTANCTGPLPKPCGECESCLSVRAGSHPDVLEIDAASNNSVDDVRELREKVSLAAMRGGKKIYILDEAHMMSRAAFNALLKTLEEPPSHVIFILATTEPEKIIPTILSRCQHYRFRRLTPEEVAGKLAGLAQQEGVNADPDALQLIGRLADGAMRDGESLLERMLAAGTAITRHAVEDALGLPPSERVRGIAAALVLGDAGAALSGAAHLYRDGFAARTVVEGLVAAFGSALHAELGLGGEALGGADVPRLLKLQAALDEQESRFARSADQQSLELALTHALLAADGAVGGGGSQSAAPGAGPADLNQRLNRLEKEVSTLRAARPAPASGGAVSGGPMGGGVADFEPTRRGAAPVRDVVREAAGQVAGQAAGVSAVQGHWADVVKQASMQVRAFLKPARMHAEPGYVSLTYDDKNAFHAKQVAGKFDDLAKLVLKVFGPVTFELLAPEGSRKVKVGVSENSGASLGTGPGVNAENGGVPAAPAPTPSPAPISSDAPSLDAASPAPGTSGASPPPPAPAPVARVEPKAAHPIAPFDPVPRRTPAGTPKGAGSGGAESPQPEALAQAAPFSAPVAQPAAQKSAPGRFAGVATLEPPLERQADTEADPGPGLGAPPPRPGAGMTSAFTTSWDDHDADQPFAASTPTAGESGGREPAGESAPPARVSRELYLSEIITEEPNWDDIGGPPEERGAPKLALDLSDAPFANLSAPRPVAPAQTSPAQTSPAQTPDLAAVSPQPAPSLAAPNRPGDIRAHPMYEEIKGRFSGRVREIGKNRNPHAAATDDPGTDDASVDDPGTGEVTEE